MPYCQNLHCLLTFCVHLRKSSGKFLQRAKSVSIKHLGLSAQVRQNVLRCGKIHNLMILPDSDVTCPLTFSATSQLLSDPSLCCVTGSGHTYLDRVKRIWYLSLMRAAKVQASLRIRTVSPEPLLLAHASSETRGTFRQKARSLAPLNGWACTVKICHDGMLEDTNLLDGAHLKVYPEVSKDFLV